MIDEWYDRNYRECRSDLHAGIDILFAKIAHAVVPRQLRKPLTPPAGELTMFARAIIILAAVPLMGATRSEPLSLAGTWVMESAYEIRADGTRSTNYSEHPSGLMMVDRAGHYAIQIYRPGRPNFVSGDKARGEPAEYRSAVLGSSAHFGRVRIDEAAHQLSFDVAGSSFPNWEGKRQVRNFTYANGVLSYAVPASASGSGTVAYSVWRKVETAKRAR